MNKKEISLLCGLVLTIIFSCCCQDIKTADAICQDTLRLHIIANSNSPADQQIKLEVRDALLAMEDILPHNCTDFATAVNWVQSDLARTEQRINSIMAQKGTGYTARCSVEKFWFDTTQYADFALPQGEYTALTVRLGKAEGKNWWCVVYPSLCTQSCGEIKAETADFITTQTITPRFKVAEIYQQIKYKLTQNKTPQYTNG